MPAQSGHIIEGTAIAVDLWKNVAAARYFFLSHLHADHIVGLTRNWKNRIYTSPRNAELISLKGLVTPSIVRPLAIGEVHVLPSKKSQETFTVTLFDANHCPGSVMFLFEGKFGNILYTGDFCYTPNIIPRNLPKIDTLYLDNTYCSDKCQFPSKEDASQEVVKTLLGCLHSSKLVIVGIDSLGKEDLVVQIAEAAKMKAHMDPERASVFKLLGLEHVTTCDPVKTRIHIRPTRQVSRKNIEAWNQIKPTCGILATSRFVDNDFTSPENECPGLHTVLYSCHSSFNGLRDFVKEIRPRKILPIVDASVKGIGGKDISERADMTVFEDLCRSYRRKGVRTASEERPRKRPRRRNGPKTGHVITCVTATGSRIYHVHEGTTSEFDVLFNHLK